MGAYQLNDRADSAVRRAMALTGSERNLSGFARMLSRVAGGEGTTHRSVRRWLEGGTVPAWALIAAARAAGTSVGMLLEDEAPADLAVEVARQADEIRALWAAVGAPTSRAIHSLTEAARSMKKVRAESYNSSATPMHQRD